MAGAERLYALTDEAIRACPPSTRWALATNGDNAYADGFLEALLRAPPAADAVALDYHSRYHRSTGPPCTRFERRPGTPPCKRNRQGPGSLGLRVGPHSLHRHLLHSPGRKFLGKVAALNTYWLLVFLSNGRVHSLCMHACMHTCMEPCLQLVCEGQPAAQRRMQWCSTDLGATAYSWRRLLAEGRRFGAPGPEAEGLGAEHYDGILASAVVNDGGERLQCVMCSCLHVEQQQQRRGLRCGKSMPISAHNCTSVCGRVERAPRHRRVPVRPPAQPAGLRSERGDLGRLQVTDPIRCSRAVAMAASHGCLQKLTDR